MTFIASMFIYGKDRIRTLMLTIVFSIGFYAAKGVVFVINTGGAGRINGVEGSFLDGNTFIGLAFVMVCPLTIYLARTEQRPWLRRTLYTLVVMTFISTIFTFSRGAYLGLVAIIPMIFLRAQRKAIATCILIPTVLIVPNVVPDSVFDRIFDRVERIEGYESDRSANQRLQSWTVAWNLAKDFPLRGAGFEFEYSPDETRWLQYTSEKYSWALTHSSSAHSIYFQILGQHGFLALGLFLVLLFGTLLSLQRTKRRTEGNPETSWIANYASGLQVGLAGYMVTGAFLSSAYFDLLYLYIALSAILGREVQSLTLQRKAQRPQGVRMMGQDIASLPRHG
jgi:putative inorganic carbon (HCO3(-)) transporter